MSKGKNKRRPDFPLHPDEAKRWFGIEPPPAAVALVKKQEATKLEPKGEVALFVNGEDVGRIGNISIEVEGSIFLWLIFERETHEYHLIDCAHRGADAPREYVRRYCSEDYGAAVVRKLYSRGSDPSVDLERLGAAIRGIDER